MIHPLDDSNLDPAVTLYDAFLPILEVIDTTPSTKIHFLLMLAITMSGKSANTRGSCTNNIEFLNTLLSDINEFSTSQPTRKPSSVVLSGAELLDTLKALFEKE